MKDCVISKLKLPNLNGLNIEYNSNVDADLISFLRDCTPAHLRLFVIKCWRFHPEEINSKFFTESFSKIAARISKEVFFFSILFNAKDFQTIVKAACNTERIMFRYCSINYSSGFDFGSDLIYKTKFLSFQN